MSIYNQQLVEREVLKYLHQRISRQMIAKRPFYGLLTITIIEFQH